MIPSKVSIETRALADQLIATPVGDVVTLSGLSRAIGRDVGRCRHLLYAALNIVRRESGAVFASERGVGYRRLSVEDTILKTGSTARTKIRRTARRARRVLADGTRSANELALDMQRKAAAEFSSLALLEHLARDKVVSPTSTDPIKPTPVAVTARVMLSRITGAS